MSSIHTETYRIRAHEIDVEKKITVPSIIQIMQEASMQHIIHLGASVWDMEKDEKSWILLRKRVEIFDRPPLNEQITVRTFPSGFDKFFAYRDFKCFDEAGKLFAQASSCWVLVDINTKQISRILPRLEKLENPDEDILPRPNFKLPVIDSIHLAWTHRVSRFELDWNHHLNNSYLNKIILSSTSQENSLKEYQVSYKSEAFLDDILEVYTIEDENGVNLKVWNTTTEKVVALAKVSYKQ